jgi:hypothetical protein
MDSRLPGDDASNPHLGVAYPAPNVPAFTLNKVLQIALPDAAVVCLLCYHSRTCIPPHTPSPALVLG